MSATSSLTINPTCSNCRRPLSRTRVKKERAKANGNLTNALCRGCEKTHSPSSLGEWLRAGQYRYKVVNGEVVSWELASP